MNRFQLLGRSGQVPRSVLLLTILVLAAAAVLFVVSRRSTPHSDVLGGSLLDLEGTSINGFLFTHGGAQYRFDKNDVGYWTLRGGTTDYLDQNAIPGFLKDLAAGQGGRLFPGTEIEDRRYEFNGPEAMRLTVFTADGRHQKLALGVANPVSGNYYASGIGRPGCFPVSEVFHHRLAGLPSSLQLPRLLPYFDRTQINQVELWYGQELQVLKRYDERWWLRQPAGGVVALGAEASAYHQKFSDRKMERDGHTWLLARDDLPYQVVYEASEIIINEFPSPREALGRLQEYELDPPWRRVKLYGAGINPDSTGSAPGMLEIALGMPQEDNRVPVLRRGNVLMTEAESLNLLSESPGDFLDVGAISFLVAGGDSLVVMREGKLVLSAVRGEAPVVHSGTQKRPLVESWQTVFPAREQRPTLRDISYLGLTRNFIVNLDRLEILKVLESTDDPRVLSEEQRVYIEVFGLGSGSEKLEFGFLEEEYLSESLVAEDAGTPPVGMWRRGTGQLLQVPGHILITIRSQAQGLGKQ